MTYGPYEIESLIFGLGLPEWESRANAASELGRYDDLRAVDALLDLLGTDENTAVLMEVVASLDRIRSRRSRDGLLAFANRHQLGTLQEERCSVAALRAVDRLDARPDPDF